MFSPPVYLCVGDEFDKRPARQTSSTKHPHSFVVPMKRSPHITDAVFQKPFVSLAVGDEYVPVPPGGTFRQPVDSKSGTVTSAPIPFRPPGRPHKSNGSGTHYGTFSEANPPRHEAELPLIAKTKASEDADKQSWPKRKIYTNPGKRGTYGYVGLTIGRAGEVQYISDAYYNTAGASQEKTPRTQEAFRAAVKRGGCFDESAHGFSTVYSISKPLPPKKPVPQNPPIQVKPWRPAGAIVNEIIKPPEYQEDPLDLKEKRIREERHREQGYKAWFPAGNDPYRHIYHAPIRYDPPEIK